MGQLGIYSLPTLRRQILLKCLKASDINALTSIQFSPFAHVFYLRSSSEFTEMTFSTQHKVYSSMAIVYDKAQRQTIKRAEEEKSTPERNAQLIDVARPSGKLSVLSSPPNSIQVRRSERFLLLRTSSTQLE